VHAAVEALAAASVLVESGDAERVVVVAVDDVGSATRALVGESRRAGSVALLVSARAGAGARARVGPITLRRGDPAESPCAPGHLSLLPLVSDALPGEVACASPPDMLARVLIAPL
jgi:hypothetical protein